MHEVHTNDGHQILVACRRDKAADIPHLYQAPISALLNRTSRLVRESPLLRGFFPVLVTFLASFFPCDYSFLKVDF